MAGVNFELTVIPDGASAFAFVRGSGDYADRPLPDVTVVDISLPKHDGIQVLEAMRASERFADMQVVVVSSSAWAPARLAELRVVRYISKPPDFFGDWR